jgi:hypothetical protein
MRDLNCNLMELAGLKQVTREPSVRNSDMSGENGLRAEWLFLMFVFSTQNPLPWSTLLCFIKKPKKNIPHILMQQNKGRASFNPFIATWDGILDSDAEMYIKMFGNSSLQQKEFEFITSNWMVTC